MAVVWCLQSPETLEDGAVQPWKIRTQLTFHLLLLLMFKVLALGLFVLDYRTDRTGSILNMLKESSVWKDNLLVLLFFKLWVCSYLQEKNKAQILFWETDQTLVSHISTNLS